MRYFSANVYSVVVHDDAEDDLSAIFELDEDVGATLATFLELLEEGNQDLLDRLTQRGFTNHNSPEFNVDEWQKAKSLKLNLWRIRLLSVDVASNYRIIYAFHAAEFRYYVLAILERSFNYEISDPRVKRIIEVYDALDIPRR